MSLISYDLSPWSKPEADLVVEFGQNQVGTNYRRIYSRYFQDIHDQDETTLTGYLSTILIYVYVNFLTRFFLRGASKFGHEPITLHIATPLHHALRSAAATDSPRALCSADSCRPVRQHDGNHDLNEVCLEPSCYWHSILYPPVIKHGKGKWTIYR